MNETHARMSVGGRVGQVFARLATLVLLGAAGCGVQEGEEVIRSQDSLSGACAVLVLDSTVSGGASSEEAQAAFALGCTVDVVPPATWATMTAAQFASYRAIILGDARCSMDEGVLSVAESNRAVWGPVVDGNVITVGTDPVYHSYWSSSPGALQLTNNAVAFAADQPGKTGA